MRVTSNAFLTFLLGGQDYALPIENVIEIAAMVEVTRVAGAAPGLLGVVNRHGAPIPMLDLRMALEQSAPPIDVSMLFIVASIHNRMVGLVVDEVLQVEYASGWSGDSTRYIEGIISQRGRLIQVVSLERVLTAHLPEV